MAVNFDIKSEEMNSTITMLKQAAEAMSDVADEMKETVKNVLLTSGLSGDTANTLAERYDQDVLAIYRQFNEQLDEYIAKNEQVLAKAEDLSSETNRIANTTGVSQ